MYKQRFQLRYVTQNSSRESGTHTAFGGILRSEEQNETFEKFQDAWAEYISLGEEAIFEYAFKLGAQMMLEVQQSMTE